jgi:hypothetical protein
MRGLAILVLVLWLCVRCGFRLAGHADLPAWIWRLPFVGTRPSTRRSYRYATNRVPRRRDCWQTDHEPTRPSRRRALAFVLSSGRMMSSHRHPAFAASWQPTGAPIDRQDPGRPQPWLPDPAKGRGAFWPDRRGRRAVFARSLLHHRLEHALFAMQLPHCQRQAKICYAVHRPALLIM